ncbi:GntR family transcriptional regulator [Actinomadura roseirufa]|uniref:GntR family transcriptional regulator n=1 Tax=Actinomadura roseirufa TaxID=2094049 RepID=UPI0010413118|nr:GntR family transcriptional regulator [Actinomadura roseirufa]
MSSPQRSRESAQDTTYRWLKRHIASLPRHEGTFLTEAEVCEATGTSRTPVREALLRLETEGFLTIMPKKGAFVPPVSDADIEAVMQARELVEDWCVRRAAPLAAALVPELEELIGRQEGLMDDPVGFIDCDRAFHRAIVRSAGNQVLAEFYETLRDRQVRMGLRAIAATEDRARVVLAEHTAIVAAVRSGDPLRSAEALAAHLGGTLAALRLPAVANWNGR